MRLSEDRISSIAGKIARQLVKTRTVMTKGNLRQVTTWVEKPIMADLAREDDIDREVATYIQGLSNKPPEGSYDYQALFQKKKEELSRRRGFKM
jgi:hypothetical protein